MTTMLAVFSCASCSMALLRHWHYFERQEADINLVIATEDKPCSAPDGVEQIKIGLDLYIMGPHLPVRMMNTISILLERPWDVLILAEYDTLIFHPIEVRRLKKVAAHFAGQFHLDYAFYHNPWVFSRGTARRFIEEGAKVVSEGRCQEGEMHASPDVFFGLVCHRMDQPVQANLWRQFSRNSLDCEGDLEKARVAYLAGIDIIHGVKSESELNYITK